MKTGSSFNIAHLQTAGSLDKYWSDWMNRLPVSVYPTVLLPNKSYVKP